LRFVADFSHFPKQKGNKEYKRIDKEKENGKMKRKKEKPSLMFIVVRGAKAR